jgi:hypothetical protein
MIISEKHKYIFVELPHTGSTAISNELCENYDGERIMKYHSFFHELQGKVTNKNDYFVFSGIRNPLDEVVSIYLKYKTDQITEYEIIADLDRASRQRYTFAKNNSYQDYLRRFYKIPYDNWSCLSHSQFDYVIKFENIQNDFQTALCRIGLALKRPLPIVNPTRQKRHYLTYYPPEIYDYARYVFGPFMKRWNYLLPYEWGDSSVPNFAEIVFAVFRLPRKIYYRYIQHSRSVFAKPFRMARGH